MIARLSLLTDSKLDSVAAVYAALIEDASADVYRAGMLWYVQAHTECARISAETGVPLDRVAGIMAALSPRTPWDVNLQATWDVARRGTDARRPVSGLAWNTTGNVGKALSILHGEIDTDSAFRPDTKTWAFSHNIRYPWTSQRVTLDQWALRVIGLPESAQGPGYRLIADAVTRAGHACQIAPPQAQAIAWIVAREVLTLRPGEYVDLAGGALTIVGR